MRGIERTGLGYRDGDNLCAMDETRSQATLTKGQEGKKQNRKRKINSKILSHALWRPRVRVLFAPQNRRGVTTLIPELLTTRTTTTTFSGRHADFDGRFEPARGGGAEPRATGGRECAHLRATTAVDDTPRAATNRSQTYAPVGADGRCRRNYQSHGAHGSRTIIIYVSFNYSQVCPKRVPPPVPLQCTRHTFRPRL